ncbi:MAG: DeoR family transcriptional regulator [Patescibacteria group bacterium]|nr:DeoR family transcriptional regulator [Patescibacteria group bacterium]
MDKNYLIQLTNNLYRLTLLFPKKEPLRYKMRELADEVLAKCLRWNLKQNPVLEDLEVLDGFFEVAKRQNWVSPVELLRIQEEYNRIKAEIKKITKRLPAPPERKATGGRPLQTVNSRQEKILAILKERGRAQVWQIKQIFPEVTKRTLRRDFESLLKKGIIERIGERNETFYQLRNLTP